ncbi:MAG: oligoribonuclease [Nevskia sp.]|nr:oligoribonuclease [Nevskia sp.]
MPKAANLASMNPHPTNLIWIDCEMTGLVPERHRLIEIATIVTDAHLNVIAESPAIALHQSDAELEAMDEWNTTQHGRSGLIRRVRESGVDEAAATTQMLAFLAKWSQPGRSPMCGNSICQDRRFLARHMPELERYFHYRNLDVSTLKELCHRWAPMVARGFNKESKHLALDDIRDSIAELRYYREHFLRVPTAPGPM